MVFCPHCGKENEINAEYCENCGKELKNEDKSTEKKGLNKLINFKGIIIGAIIAVILYFVFIILLELTLDPALLSDNLLIVITLVVLVFPILVGGFIAGYYSKIDYSSGILNGLIVGILMFIFFIELDLIILFIGMLIYLPAGVAGGFLGVYYNKKWLKIKENSDHNF